MATRHLYEIVLDPKRRLRVYATGEDLLLAATEYFKFVVDHPIETQKHAFHQGEHVRAMIQKVRIVSLSSLLAWLGVGDGTWKDWKRDRPELFDAIQNIERALKDYILVNASAGTLSEQISIRLLGLKDLKDIEVRGDYRPNPADVTEEEIAAERKRRGIDPSILEE